MFGHILYAIGGALVVASFVAAVVISTPGTALALATYAAFTAATATACHYSSHASRLGC